MSTKDEKEWERINANPNNMIVSDVLKPMLPDEYYKEAIDNDGTIKAVLESDDKKITFKVTSLERNANGWVLISTTSKRNAIEMIRNSTTEWSSLRVTLGVDEELTTLPVEGKNIYPTVMIPEPLAPGMNTAEAIVTIVCVKET